MRNGIQFKTVLLCVLLLATMTHAKKYIVLMAGQSNMAGRGIIGIPDDTLTYGSIVSFNKDSVWVRARNPLSWDKPEAGVGMGISFGRELQALLKSNDTIGLVPCAAGGTSIDNWLGNKYFAYTGNFYLYSNLINRARKAAKSGTILGMIWHQGEADATTALYPTYQNKLHALFDSIRTDLKMPTMPIVAGELGRFLINNSNEPRWDSINVAIHNLKNVLQHYDVASSQGLTSNSDITHFTSASQDTFGIRYARLFYALLNQDTAQDSITVREAESLAVSGITTGDTMRVFGIGNAADPNLSGGFGSIFQAQAVGDYISYTVNVPYAGACSVRLGVKAGNNRGIFQLAVNGTDQGPPLDLYAPANAYQELDAASFSFDSAGEQTFTFTVTGKNTSSGGYWLALDYIKLIYDDGATATISGSGLQVPLFPSIGDCIVVSAERMESNHIRIKYVLPPASFAHVLLQVFDLRGNLQQSLVDQDVRGGVHTVDFGRISQAGGKVAAGRYLCRLRVCSQAGIQSHFEKTLPLLLM
jgi:hypothetical protein